MDAGVSSPRKEDTGPVYEDEIELQLKNMLRMVAEGLPKNKKDQELLKIVTR
jgi:hypothetical protein